VTFIVTLSFRWTKTVNIFSDAYAQNRKRRNKNYLESNFLSRRRIFGYAGKVFSFIHSN